MIYKFTLFILLTVLLFYYVTVSEYLYNATTILGCILVVLWTSWTISAWSARVFIHQLLLPRIDPKNKAVLITGCDTGFGNFFAQKLNAYGFVVFACCLNVDSDGARNLTKNAKYTHNMYVLSMDVTSAKSVFDAKCTVIKHLEERHLDMWGIVNNAGIARCSEVEWGDIEHEYKTTFDVNVLGVVRVTREFLPLLRKSSGRIVNMASIAGRLTFPLFTSYSMSKHAVISFSDGLRRELDKFGIRVISIEPFIYKTPMIVNDLTASMATSWSRTSEDIKRDYGQCYYNALSWYVSAFVGYYNPLMVRSDPQEVVDTVQEALTSSQPEHTYVNCNPLLKPSFALFIYFVPYEIFEFYMKYYTITMKFMSSFFK